MKMRTQLTKGSIVQFKMDWDKQPTPANTSIVTRVAKDSSWADVVTPFGKKRVPNPTENLNIVTEPLVVQF
jgi:hypothetical protein